MTSYASQYPPSVPFDPAFKTFFEDFYRISDDPEAHEIYADQFTPDATLVMASKRVQGRDEIIAVRKAMWEKVASRLHKPLKIFPYGPDSDQVMLHGSVAYGLKDNNNGGGDGGDNVSVEWAAYAHLVKGGDDGVVRMDFYQVYLDTAAQKR
ncbi:hypothetical protein K504DRAFT_397581 [Pleomassaria siparia CBS 279.74]|uniref:SnoaL-like domain-containing protein n=1 Tax=Pleomassaria siparia CBS 279.74 TaxID=1314801 RepID=A0A6G1KJ60_9PLEO|nr:hypothetical protein K504DRAFT_397581 [Pleomassaria siparia CBS 279.74]